MADRWAFYTDKASLFRTHGKRRRGESEVDQDPADMPLTQIGGPCGTGYHLISGATAERLFLRQPLSWRRQ
jgi:hypothetical protein